MVAASSRLLCQCNYFCLLLLLKNTTPVWSFALRPLTCAGTPSRLPTRKIPNSVAQTANIRESNETMNDKEAIAILRPREPLPYMGDDGITVLSFNVLLPNGNDGWWIYKVSQRISASGSTKGLTYTFLHLLYLTCLWCLRGCTAARVRCMLSKKNPGVFTCFSWIMTKRYGSTKPRYYRHQRYRVFIAWF